MHPIDALCYNQLRANGYEHIYQINNNENIMYYLIFGPITLARKDMLATDALSTTFSHALMIFQMGCGQVYHDEESWEDGFKYYDGHSLKIEDAC